jgi:2-phospho-L-lactate guanylyltransferase
MDIPAVSGLPRSLDPRLGCCALVAIKRRSACKGRLADALAPPERLELVRAMLAHVIGALGAAQTVRQIVVVSPERDLVPAQFPVLADRGAGLNVALAEARAALLSLGAHAVLVLPADLPCVTAEEIDRFVRAGRRGFALAPDAAGTGTNALYLGTDQPFEFHFGQDSKRRHLRVAEALGLRPRILRSPGLAFDIDAPGDLARLHDTTPWSTQRHG